jgi:glycogen debranching enzyme
MARPLATDSISLTGAGAGLVTDAAGSIEPTAVAGLFVDDVRVVSAWRLSVDGLTARLVGRERTGPSSDRLFFTLASPESIDPVAVMQRDRTVTGRGFHESLRITAYTHPLTSSLRLTVARDDMTVYEIGDDWTRPGSRPILDAASVDRFVLPGPPEGPGASIEAPGWRLVDDALTIDASAEPGAVWEGTVAVAASSTERLDSASETASTVAIATNPGGLATVVEQGRTDLRALTIPMDGRDVLGAGAPFFLALYGRDSLISGVQALVDLPDRLTDILAVLARHQGTGSDATTRSQPGQILHELRVGRMGLFGVSPGTPYFGAIDTAALFVVALGEAMHWGARRDDIAALVPPARKALEWCRQHGDVDGDGFIESVPHPSGLTNLHWKDSSDSIVREDGSTFVGTVALPEVQAYWYRALRSMAEIERWIGTSDGAADLAGAERLARRFAESFLFESEGRPFVGLALDDAKRLLNVRASNAGHVLWAGVLPADVAVPVAEQLLRPDLFSGWGVRTLSSTAPGYNPFGYHRGSVWPHDTALALHGAARYGVTSAVQALGDGLVALGLALAELPELVSGIARDELSRPVPYAAACRPQAWAAGAPLMVLRALLGLEPDVPAGVVRLHPSLSPGTTVEMHNLQLGEHTLSVTAQGDEIIEVDAPGLDVVTGPDAVLASTTWCPPRDW